MTMAEGELLNGATLPVPEGDEATPDADVQSSVEQQAVPAGLTRQDLDDFGRTLWQAFDRRITNVEMRAASIEQVRDRLEEQGLHGQRLEAAVNAVLDATIGSEAREANDKQVRERLEADRLKARAAALETALRERNRTPARPRDDDPNDPQVQDRWNRVVHPRLEKAAKREGVDLDAVKASQYWPKTFAGGLDAFEDKAATAIEQYAAQEAAGRGPRPRVAAARPAGNGGGPANWAQALKITKPQDLSDEAYFKLVEQG